MFSLFRKINSRGSALLWSLIAVAIVGAGGYLAMSTFEQSKKVVVSQKVALEMEFLAEDIKEFGKYLLFYEKVFYAKKSGKPANPLILDDNIRQIWGQPFSVVASNPCGAYDFKINFVGNSEVNGKKIFCSHLFRNNRINNGVLEIALLEKWSQNGAIDKVAPGKYRVEVDMSNIFDNTGFINFRHGQSIAGKATSSKTDFTASLIFELYSSKAGFELGAAQRLVKIIANVQLGGGLFSGRVFQKTSDETFVISPSSAKAYAIFNPFPVEKIFNDNFSLSNSDNIYGKTFYNGDMNFDSLSTLPTFHDTVVLSGSAKTPIIPTIENVEKLKNVFTRGLITNMNAERFLFNPDNKGGGCVSKSVPILNGTQLACNATIDDYISMVAPACRLTVHNKGYLHYLQDPDDFQNCESNNPAITDRFISGGFSWVDVNYQCLFSMAAIKQLKINTSTSIYGVVAGGQLQKTKSAKVDIYSLSNIGTGTPCITDQSALDDINILASQVKDTVLIPLINLPSVYSLKTGFR